MSNHQPGIRIDIAGQKFGRLLVVSQVSIPGRGKAHWNCTCDCGNHCVVSGVNLRRGRTKSCGCLHRERAKVLHLTRDYTTSQRRGTHQQSRTRLHNIWSKIIDRCTNENRPDYRRYGGRGIKMHKPWMESFVVFRDAVGQPPSSGHTLDRIDNDGHYEPGNVRWVTFTQQNRNRSNNRRYQHDGLTLTAAEWSERTGINQATIRKRIESGWPVEEAISKPPGSRPSRRT